MLSGGESLAERTPSHLPLFQISYFFKLFKTGIYLWMISHNQTLNGDSCKVRKCADAGKMAPD